MRLFSRSIHFALIDCIDVMYEKPMVVAFIKFCSFNIVLCCIVIGKRVGKFYVRIV